jgi:hypothetical protein
MSLEIRGADDELKLICEADLLLRPGSRIEIAEDCRIVMSGVTLLSQGPA